MNTDYEQIKIILLGLEIVSDSQYNRLIEVYGKDSVVGAIKELYEEDSSILLKVGKFVSNLYLNLDLSKEMKSAYCCYSDDLDMIKKLNSNEKKLLLDNVVFISKKLNKICDKTLGSYVLENGRVPWINDKVEYFIEKCDDRDLLGKIKKLYNEYIEKRNILIEQHLGFVIMITRKFVRDGGVPFDDLIQYGNIGLMRAVEMYNPDKDTNFLSYASYWIQQSVINNSKKILCKFKIPIKIYDLYVKKAKTIECLTNELGRVPTNEEVADYLEISVLKLDEITLLFNDTISSEDLMLDIDDRENDFELIDDTINLDKDMIYDEMRLELKHLMKECLTEREIFILESRYGFIRKMTLSELSEIYGISLQRISEISKSAIMKLYNNKEFKKMKIYLR